VVVLTVAVVAVVAVPLVPTTSRRNHRHTIHAGVRLHTCLVMGACTLLCRHHQARYKPQAAHTVVMPPMSMLMHRHKRVVVMVVGGHAHDRHDLGSVFRGDSGSGISGWSGRRRRSGGPWCLCRSNETLRCGLSHVGAAERPWSRRRCVLA